MSSDPVFEKLSSLLVRVIGDDIVPVRLDAKLIDDYDANSMDLVELADRSEDVFGITFPTEDLKQMRTVADLLSYITSKIPAV